MQHQGACGSDPGRRIDSGEEESARGTRGQGRAGNRNGAPLRNCLGAQLPLGKVESAGFYCSFDFVSNIDTDHGVSGTKDHRPALDELPKDVKRRRFNVVVCWRLARLGRNLRHLITLLEELRAMGVAFVSLHEGIDATTPAGKLQMHILGAIAEFERAGSRSG